MSLVQDDHVSGLTHIPAPNTIGVGSVQNYSPEAERSDTDMLRQMGVESALSPNIVRTTCTCIRVVHDSNYYLATASLVLSFPSHVIDY